MENQESLPKPELDLPLPEKEIPASFPAAPASSTPPTEPKKSLPKGIIFAVVILVLVIISGMGVYFLGKKSVNKTPPAPATQTVIKSTPPATPVPIETKPASPEASLAPYQTPNPSPSCRPRPACLDATPRCMIPVTSDMCPPAVTPSP